MLDAVYRNASYKEVVAQLVQPARNEPWYHYYAIPDADMWEYFRRNAKLPYNPLEWLEKGDLATGYLKLIANWLKERVNISQPD